MNLIIIFTVYISDVSWVISTPRAPVPASLHLEALQLKPIWACPVWERRSLYTPTASRWRDGDARERSLKGRVVLTTPPSGFFCRIAGAQSTTQPWHTVMAPNVSGPNRFSFFFSRVCSLRVLSRSRPQRELACDHRCHRYLVRKCLAGCPLLQSCFAPGGSLYVVTDDGWSKRWNVCFCKINPGERGCVLMVRAFRLIPLVSVTTATLYWASVARLIEAVWMKICKIEELCYDYEDSLFSILLFALSATNIQHEIETPRYAWAAASYALDNNIYF